MAAAALLAASMASAAAAPPSPAARAQMTYVHQCIGCHRIDGSGAPDKGIPSMRGNLGEFLKVPGGREFIVQVPGVMNTALTDRQIAELMNWLLPRMAASTMPPDAAPYTEQEIAQARKTRPVNVIAKRRELVEAAAKLGVSIDTR